VQKLQVTYFTLQAGCLCGYSDVLVSVRFNALEDSRRENE